ncbi:MAG: tetratricopeptide repeat protein, partial [Pseudomonadales bacterium]
MSYRLTQFFAGACLSVILATTAHATQSTASSEYRQGTNAFREGNFEQALEHFEAARNMGQETPGLVYNMAVTHYKLNNLDEAEVLFEELANRYPDWRDLGRYNLGRIAMRRGNDDQAAKYFRLVQRTASNDELVYLAG